MSYIVFFFFNDPATTEIYTLSLHDALPISGYLYVFDREVYADKSLGEPYLIFPTTALRGGDNLVKAGRVVEIPSHDDRSEEHTSELQSRRDLVCRLLLEKKNQLKIH